MSEPTYFTKFEMELLHGSLDFTLNNWISWLAKDDLPGGWNPRDAEAVIETLEGLIKKFHTVSAPPWDEEEIEDEELPNNVLHFPFGGEE